MRTVVAIAGRNRPFMILVVLVQIRSLELGLMEFLNGSVPVVQVLLNLNILTSWHRCLAKRVAVIKHIGAMVNWLSRSLIVDGWRAIFSPGWHLLGNISHIVSPGADALLLFCHNF